MLNKKYRCVIILTFIHSIWYIKWNKVTHLGDPKVHLAPWDQVVLCHRGILCPLGALWENEQSNFKNHLTFICYNANRPMLNVICFDHDYTRVSIIFNIIITHLDKYMAKCADIKYIFVVYRPGSPWLPGNPRRPCCPLSPLAPFNPGRPGRPKCGKHTNYHHKNIYLPDMQDRETKKCYFPMLLKQQWLWILFMVTRWVIPLTFPSLWSSFTR